MTTQNSGPTPLPFYGIHEDDGLPFLYQDTCPQGWEFIGLNRKSNQTVKQLKNQCSHNINVNLATRKLSKLHVRKFEAIMNDPLVQAMLPIPNGKTYFLDEQKLENSAVWLSCLERLNSPLHTWVKPAWVAGMAHIAKHMAMTNIHPMAITGFSINDGQSLSKLAEISMTAPRTVIFSGNSSLIIPKSVERIDTRLGSLISLQELVSLPLEHLGSYIMAKYCMGERQFNRVA